MNDETTRLLNETAGNTQSASTTSNGTGTSAKGKKSSKKSMEGAMYAAGGAGVGAAVGAGVTATAAKTENPVLDDENEKTEDAVTTENQENSTDAVETPAEEQIILANDEGVRYAHVDADNFNDAFAQARAQVGAGGVFEYNGRLYGTFTSDEWNGMSDQQRADYQSRVNEVAPAHHSTTSYQPATTHHASTAVDTGANQTQVEHVAHNAEMISAEPVEGEIRVLGVQAVQTPEGQVMNVAVLENGTDQALLVDVDNSGTMDVLLHDDNGDGMLQENEVYDISEAGIRVDDLLAAEAAQQGDYYYTANDDMPDYINDADSMMSV